MPDERLDSARQGIGAPPESPTAAEAADERRKDLVRNPSPASPPEGALGGTSDAETAGDEAQLNAAIGRGLPEDRASENTGDAAS